MLASMSSPERMISLRGKLRSMTINAPTFCLLMLMQAMTIGMMSSLFVFLLSFLLRRMSLRRLSTCRCVPIVKKKLRISSWNRIISASVPTLTSLSRMEPKSFISSIWETNNQNTTKISTPKNTFSERDSFMTL